MKTVFITGATGTMGLATVKKFAALGDEFHIRLLARDSEKNRSLLEPYMDAAQVLWGDL